MREERAERREREERRGEERRERRGERRDERGREGSREATQRRREERRGERTEERGQEGWREAKACLQFRISLLQELEIVSKVFLELRQSLLALADLALLLGQQRLQRVDPVLVDVVQLLFFLKD